MEERIVMVELERDLIVFLCLVHVEEPHVQEEMVLLFQHVNEEGKPLV